MFALANWEVVQTILGKYEIWLNFQNCTEMRSSQKKTLQTYGQTMFEHSAHFICEECFVEKKWRTSFGANLQNVLNYIKSLIKIMSLNADDISDIALIVLCDRK